MYLAPLFLSVPLSGGKQMFRWVLLGDINLWLIQDQCVKVSTRSAGCILSGRTFVVGSHPAALCSTCLHRNTDKWISTFRLIYSLLLLLLPCPGKEALSAWLWPKQLWMCGIRVQIEARRLEDLPRSGNSLTHLVDHKTAAGLALAYGGQWMTNACRHLIWTVYRVSPAISYEAKATRMCTSRRGNCQNHMTKSVFYFTDMMPATERFTVNQVWQVFFFPLFTADNNKWKLQWFNIELL